MIQYFIDLWMMPTRIAWIAKRLERASINHGEALRLARELRKTTDSLAAVLPAGWSEPKRSTRGFSMNPLQPILDEITRAQGVNASVIALVNAFPAHVQAAIDAALAGGATGAQVAEAVAKATGEFKASVDDVLAAVNANPIP